MLELRSAFRTLAKSPAFSLAAIATLALGIGCTVLVYSVLYSVVLNPLPYRDPGQLVFIWIDDVKRGIHGEGLGYPTFLEWKAQAASFQDIAVRGRGYSATITDTQPERLLADVVSANYFSVLAIPPEAGAVFTDQQEQQGELVAVISHRLALRRFGSPASAIGKPIEFERRIWRITGVMPPRYGIPPFQQDLWLPARKLPSLEKFMTRRDWDFFMGIGRLAPGKSAAEAQTELNTIGARLALAYPNTDPEFGGYGTAVIPFDQQILGRGLPRALWMLMAAASLLLLICCLNIANLLLARGAARRPEFAIRNALGAGLARLIRQQMAEGFLLAIAGGAAGFALALLGLRVLPLVAPANLPRFDDLHAGTPVLLFALTASLAACCVFGLVPAWLEARNALPSPTARITTPGAGRLQSALIVSEFALSLVLLSGAGLFLQSLLSVERTPAGFDTRRTLLFQVELGWSQPGEKNVAFYRDLLSRLRALPGVEAAGAITDFFIERNPDEVITVQGRAPAAHEQATGDAVSPGFLEAAGARLIEGRFLDDSDYGKPSPNTAVVNETLARRFFPGQSAIGQHFKFGNPASRHPWIEIVGVIADMHRLGLETAPVSEVFGPAIGPGMDVLVRTSVPPDSLSAAARDVVRQVNPAIPVYGLTTIEARLAEFAAERRLQTWLLSGFSILALLLAAVGIFGLMQYTVSMRVRENAIRCALGETSRQTRNRVLLEGFLQAAAGIAIGCIAAAALGQTIQSMLYGLRAFHPPTLAAASAVLTAVALAACWIPALKAGRANLALLMRE